MESSHIARFSAACRAEVSTLQRANGPSRIRENPEHKRVSYSEATIFGRSSGGMEMRRLLAWWKARAAVGGVGSLLLRFAIGLAIPLILVVVLSVLAQAVIAGH